MSSPKHFDVIVVGGGVSGFVAAAAASRNGAKTLLVERDGALGGTMTNALVGPMMTFHSGSEPLIRGIPQEVVKRLVALGASPGHVIDTTGYVKTVTPFDSEGLKLVAQRMVLESGAQILLNSWVQDVILEGNTLRGVTVLNKGGSEDLYGRVLIDASGDGDLAFRSGAPWAMGRENDHAVQPVSLMFKVGPVDPHAIKDHIFNHPEDFKMTAEGIQALQGQSHIAVNGFMQMLAQSITNGELSLNRDHVLFFSSSNPDEAVINMSRIAVSNPLDAWEMSRAELLGREQMAALLAFLQHHIPGFEKARILAAGSRVGVRESRRILGEYILTGEDILGGAHFPDAVLRYAYPIDLHPSITGESNEDRFLKSGEYYEIPYRCLVPLKVEQLLVAGRCISATHEAQGSLRTSPACMALGQAAGTAAALSIREESSPRNLSTALLQQVLRHQGVFI